MFFDSSFFHGIFINIKTSISNSEEFINGKSIEITSDFLDINSSMWGISNSINAYFDSFRMAKVSDLFSIDNLSHNIGAVGEADKFSVFSD
jgi:hypothetical protein